MSVRARAVWLGVALLAAAAWAVWAGRERAPGPGPAPGSLAPSLKVRVLAPGRAGPAAGAAITLLAGGRSFAATADVTGLGLFPGPLPSGAGELEARAQGAAYTRQKVALRAGLNAAAIVLAEEALLRGVVVDETGATVGGASVVVSEEEGAAAASAPGVAPEGEATGLASARSDDQGEFVVRGLAAGRYAVSASAPLHERAVLPSVPAPSAEPARVVLVRTSELRGLVRGLDGAPLPGATVVAAGSGLWPPRRLTSDAQGRFALSPLPAGIYELRASSADAVSAPREGLLLEPASALEVELPLIAGARLSGRVLDEDDGTPLAGAELEVIEDALTATPARAVADADGRFAVSPLRAVRQRVWVRAPGYVPLVGASFVPGTTPQRIALSRAGVLEGVVVDESGAPVVGAQLEVIGKSTRGAPVHVVGPALELGATSVPPPATDSLAVTSGPIPKVPLVPLPVAAGDDPSALLGGLGFLSEAGGRFRIEGVPAGRFELVARMVGYASSRSAPLELGAGKTSSGLRVVLARGVAIAGRVVDARGFPAPGVRIELVLAGEPIARVTLSAPDGAFAFEAVRGQGLLAAYPTGAPAVQQQVDLRGSGRQEVTLQLGGDTRSLQGRVVDARGFPIESAVVRVRALDPRSPEARATTVGRDGMFTISGLPAPPYRVEAEHPSFAPTVLSSVSPALGSELQVELRPGASLRGQVRDALSSEPIAAAAIQLTRPGQPPSQVLTDASGSFELRNLSADNYTLIVRHPPHVGARVEVAVRAGEERVLDAFSLQPGGDVSGDVVDRFGAPVGGAEVALGDPVQWSGSTRTDATGHFQLAGVAPGEQRLWARHRQAGELAVPVRVRVYARQESPGLVLRLPDALR